MDYIPVYDGEEPDTGSSVLKISVDKVQKLGVRTEPATMRTLGTVVRAVGKVAVDERRVFTVAPKFEGWVERLFVNATGQPVSKGQPLFEAYSPELITAQREYGIAMDAARALKDAGEAPQGDMRRLADASLARLRNWDISDDQIRALAQSGQTQRTLTFRAPVGGIVLEKKAVQGMRFMPGDALFQIADLSSVWVLADVNEQDISTLRTGDQASVAINAYPDRTFQGKITYIYATLTPETRTVPVRIEIANPQLLLKPAMFAQVELQVGAKGKVLMVPTSAVIDSGTRRIVLIQRGEGRFEPREVKLGARSDNYVEVLDGLKDGEEVVVSANFLIDSESNLKAAVQGFGSSGQGAAAQGAPAKTGVGYQSEGTVKSIDSKTGSVSIAHAPIPALKWPAMTMEFKAANPALLAGAKPGSKIGFEFVERAPGEWVITKVMPQSESGMPEAKSTAPAANPASTHSGH